MPDDMTVAIQGPHAGAYLADMGADVVKVERPGGELNRYVRGPGFASPSDVMGTQYVAMNAHITIPARMQQYVSRSG